MLPRSITMLKAVLQWCHLRLEQPLHCAWMKDMLHCWKHWFFHTLAYHLNIATVKAPEPVVICRNKAEKGGVFAERKYHLVAVPDRWQNLKSPVSYVHTLNPKNQRHICNEGQMYEIMTILHWIIFLHFVYTEVWSLNTCEQEPPNHWGCNINCFRVSKASTVEAVKKKKKFN